MSSRQGYQYTIGDSYNVFGAGHNYVLTLYRNGKRIDRWSFDSFIMGGTLLDRKIRKLQRRYSATLTTKEEMQGNQYQGKPNTYCGRSVCGLGEGHDGQCSGG